MATLKICLMVQADGPIDDARVARTFSGRRSEPRSPVPRREVYPIEDTRRA